VPNYSYNPSNELTSNSSGSYAYDANGNTLSDPSGKSYSWDFENRLTQAVVPGTGTTTFKYDPFGRRIQKSGPLGTTNYLYDGFQLVQEVDQSGNILSRYTQDRAIDEPLAQLSAGTTSYYQRDGINSISSLSNPAGAIANTYTFDSFGKLTASTGTATNPFQYTGREFDAETGIYNYLARYYDPSVGRFLSEDPIQFDGGVDFYAYVLNNPINYMDPSGLKRTCTTKIMLVTAYCGGNPRTASGKRPGPGTVATADTNAPSRAHPKPIPYPFGCDVTVDNAATDGDWNTDYEGTIQDTGAGWDDRVIHRKKGNIYHHDVLPDAWIDIWICPLKKARQWGDRYRTVTICCGTCGD
jgi:RHS repeat-associated protein